MRADYSKTHSVRDWNKILSVINRDFCCMKRDFESRVGKVRIGRHSCPKFFGGFCFGGFRFGGFRFGGFCFWRFSFLEVFVLEVFVLEVFVFGGFCIGGFCFGSLCFGGYYL